MALTSAFNSAASGLAAAGRASALVSENLANIMTEGYGRRSLGLESNSTAPGVRVIGTVRHVDPGLVSSRRGADAEHAAAGVVSGFHSRFLSLVGKAEDPRSITARLAAFDGSLIAAASRPDSKVRLDVAVTAAVDLAGSIAAASRGVQAQREQAERSIDQQVDRLNQALDDIRVLNRNIALAHNTGSGAAALQDQRQVLIDEVNEMVAVRVVPRDHGQVALFAQGGTTLLDGTAANFSFSPTGMILPEMTIDTVLSGLELKGNPVQPAGLGGGTLAAQFAVRDDLAVAAQAELDSLARDIVERFEAPGLDATLPSGAAGLFTDGGAAFSAAAETGLAGRIAVNPNLDPGQGGATWRLRDGLGAAIPGDPGSAGLIHALQDALTRPRPLAGSPFGPASKSAASTAAALVSAAARRSDHAEQALSFATASRGELRQLELSDGVDADAELQALMLIERTYAANAKVIETVDEMMQSLLRI